MQYINVKTGAVIDVPVRLSGHWQPVEAEKAEEPAKKPVKKKAVKK